MKKFKLLTKADACKLIKQIAYITNEHNCEDYATAAYFAALLSAMRGPDDKNIALKQLTTCVIRNRLDWHCGTLFDEGRSIEDLQKLVRCDTHDHFKDHILKALYALEYFGFDKPKQ